MTLDDAVCWSGFVVIVLAVAIFVSPAVGLLLAAVCITGALRDPA